MGKEMGNEKQGAFMAHSVPCGARRTEAVKVQVEDDRTGMSVETLKRAIADNLYYLQGKSERFAAPHDYYMALSYTVRDRLIHRWIKSVEKYVLSDAKMVFYLSAEFLMGRQLRKNLVSAGCWESARTALGASGINLDELLEEEPDPGLGNGGLGRLAACFLDSLSTLAVPAVGYGIRYEFGIFEQRIENGWQVEAPDKWLRLGNPWEIPRPERTYEVKLGGHTECRRDEAGRLKVTWIPERTILGTPYDTLVPGFNTNTVNTLRLWSAGASRDFDFQVFNAGDYTRAVAEKTFSENISKVLYPNDNTTQGKELRLQQQYFFVSCSLQDILRFYTAEERDLRGLHEKAAVQLNDTHPAVAVAELMRLLIDEHALEWNTAWEITEKTFGYTNHTLLAEALERWPVALFGRLLPRHLEIIYEINRRFLDAVQAKFPGDTARLWRMSLIEEGAEKQVRMANLACVGSHAINGVAASHTELLKHDVLRDFAELWPDKFSNKTNGVTPRRFLLLSNPKLALLISEKIGRNWITDLAELKQLEALCDDVDFRRAWSAVKKENKEDLAEYIMQANGIAVNPASLFDIQVKRIHEYKRQLLFALYVITLYNRIKAYPHLKMVPRTFIIGGKAAPGYFMAKLIIKLINCVADVVNNDPDVEGRLKVVFLRNFSVTIGERVYPACDLSEQISTAGKEASGTGNMKFGLNGALTIGTLDGANIEIREAVGRENFFLFGLTFDEIAALRAAGYRPRDYYDQNLELRRALDTIAGGRFSPGEPNLFAPLVDALISHDEYMLLADYQSYIDCQKHVSAVYSDSETWTTMSILNTARMGYFSADRAIGEYCRDIWHAKPYPVEIENYRQEDAGLRAARRGK